MITSPVKENDVCVLTITLRHVRKGQLFLANNSDVIYVMCILHSGTILTYTVI